MCRKGAHMLQTYIHPKMAVDNSSVIALICQEAMCLFYDDSSSSSDEDENHRKRMKKEETEITSVSLIENYYNAVVPKYSTTDFHKHFRITRQTLEILHQTIAGAISVTPHSGRPPISADEKLLMTLWFLGNREVYKSVSERFNVSTSTLFSAVVETCKALHTLSPTIIKWPDEARRNVIKHNIYDRTGFPGVIGAIGVSHIKIKGPREDAISYVNRKYFHSVILQAVCDHTMLFTSCYAGEGGRVHVAQVYAQSPLSQQTRTAGAILFPDDTHILGDGAYAIGPYVMTPYQDVRNLTPQQRTYNFNHSSARCVIEQAFAHLKGRWQRLAYLDMSRMDLIPIVIMACCVLHNICVTSGDILSDIQLVWEPHLDGPDGIIYSHAEQNLRNLGEKKRENISRNLSLMTTL